MFSARNDAEKSALFSEGRYDRDRDRVSLFVASTCKVSHVRLGVCAIHGTL